jgi:tetratricopeptide (TPR) repeat protein
MFTVLSPCFKKIILFAAVLVGVSVTQLVHADDIDTYSSFISGEEYARAQSEDQTLLKGDAPSRSCFNFIVTQEYARAQSEAQSVLQWSSIGREDQRAAHLCLGLAYGNMGQANDAFTALVKTKSLSQSTWEHAIVNAALGRTYSQLADLDKAELYDSHALNLYKTLGAKAAQISVLNLLASVVKDKKDEERALALYQEALSIGPNQPVTLNNIAMIYLQRNEYVKADELIHEALDIARHFHQADDVYRLQINLGDSLRQQGKLKEAKNELMSGLKGLHLLTVKDKGWEAKACRNLGALAKNQNKTSQARDWYVKAAAIYRSIGDRKNANKNAEDAAALGQ